jgi:hypothetical protein
VVDAPLKIDGRVTERGNVLVPAPVRVDITGLKDTRI